MSRLPFALLIAGCAPVPLAPPEGDPGVARTAAEEDAILAAANSASRDALDHDVGLDARAADNIVGHRDGADRLPGTADDDPFDTIGELDAVGYVGESALDALLAWAIEQGLLASGGDADAVTAAVLHLADTAPRDVLDHDVGLDARAADGIVAHRAGPDGLDGTTDDDRFEDLAELDAVPWVGASALDALEAYVLAHGLVGGSCLLISEVMESSGAYNKAVELTNCGTAPVRLSQHGLCLVRNDDTSCTLSAPLASVDLPPGEAWVVCRSLREHASDPYPWLCDRCDEEQPGVVTFDGDDRVLVFRDADGDGAFDEAVDQGLDMLGRMDYRPTWMPWADVVLRRCVLAPYDGVNGTWYDESDFFVSLPRNTYEHLGIAPDGAGCP